MAKEMPSVGRNSLLTFLQKSRKVENQIEDLEKKLKFWSPLLKNPDARKYGREIRDLVCRLEDVLETSFHNSQHSKERSKKSNLKKFAGFIDDIKSSWMVHSEVQEINNLDAMTVNSLQESGIRIISSDFKSSQLENDNRKDFRYQHIQRVNTHIVGMLHELNDLRKRMLDFHNRSLRSICICGVGGIGKTTLAENLYNTFFVKFQFLQRAWVHIGQDFDMEHVFMSILKQICPKSQDKEWSFDIQILMDCTYELLKGNRYLIVFDDIRSVDFWDSIHSCFPHDDKASRIIFTTRAREMATGLAAYESGIIHMKSYLTKPEASELFWKTAFTGNLNELDEPKKKDVGEVLEMCGGLPSAIVAVRETLAKKNTLQEWEIELQNVKSIMTGGIQLGTELLTLALRFEDLPYSLETCFLYMSLFPKGLKIEVEKLYFLWMAEGMISLNDCKDNETVMDLAEGYLNDLVKQKMVNVEEGEISSLTKYKFCWVPEYLHGHFLPKGEEYFFEVLHDHSSLSLTGTSTRRLALHFHKQDDGSHVDQNKTEICNRLRSLMAFNLQDLEMKCELPREISDLKRFRKLKILTFEGIDFKKRDLPRGLTKLTFLRYLSFRGCILEVLPSSVGDLSYLETLDLQVSNLIIIPNVLNKLKKLRYLYLPLLFNTVTSDKLHLGSLFELEILENFDTGKCDIADLSKMMNLRYLSTTVEGDVAGLDQIVDRLNLTPEYGNALLPCVNVKRFDCYTEERHSVFRKLLSCEILHTLYIDGHLAEIPLHNQISTSLTQIVLKGSQLKEDPMRAFCKLPKLQVIVLQDDAVLMEKMSCSASGFVELKRLQLLNLSFLETWKVEDKAMPKLSVLIIKNCSKLKPKVADKLKLRFGHIKFEIDDAPQASFA